MNHSRQTVKSVIACLVIVYLFILQVVLYDKMKEVSGLDPSLVGLSIFLLTCLIIVGIFFIFGDPEPDFDFGEDDDTESRLHAIEKEQAEQANMIGWLLAGRYIHPVADNLPAQLETRLHDIELELAEISHNYTIMAQSLQAATQKMEHMVNYPASMQQSNNTPSPY